MNLTKKEAFINKFNKKYPGYEIIEFTNASSPIIFKDLEGNLHKKNSAFRVLSHNIRFDSIIDKERYIQNKLDLLNTNLKLISFKGMKEKLIVKDINGFTYSPTTYDLLKGHKVSIETCNEKEALFEYKANLKHNSKYIYPSFKYINGKQIITILCPTHGEFTQKIECHLHGNGCPKCKTDQATYDRKKWILNHINKSCTFYILEVFNINESFIKIGITSRNIKTRYVSLKNYNYRILVEIKGTSEYINDLEIQYLKAYKAYKYTPYLGFEGHTECFSIIIKDKIYEQFKQHCPRE